MLSYKKFVKIYILFFLIIFIIYSLLFIFSYTFIVKTGENLSIQDVIKLQNKEPHLYAQIADVSTFDYMLELLKLKKPKIIAIGSSRVMQFRQEMFKNSFVTTGGVMPNVRSGRVFLEEMLKIHKPDKIILGLDIWWFNPNYTYNKYEVEKYNKEKKNTLHQIDMIIKYVFDGKIKLSELILPGRYKNKKLNIRTIGYSAYKNGDGTMPDGSHFYGADYYSGTKTVNDEKFKNTFDRIENGNGRFQTGENVDKNALGELNKIIEICENNNIKLILFFPPFANSVYEKMQSKSNDYKYIDNLKKYLNNKKIKYFDFENPDKLNSCNCEFIDGFHGGNVTYAKIAMALLPDDVVNNLDEIINKNKNRTLIKFHPEYYNFEETDFLKIGCKK